MKILVTGAAGFIGFHTAKALLLQGHEVVGVDNCNPYYDPRLKEARLLELTKIAQTLKADAATPENWSFIRGDLADPAILVDVFQKHCFDRVVHLAAQAGVRHSLVCPQDYVQSNLVAFANLLEVCRHNKVAHLVYASTSSVYGANTTLPFSEEHSADHPLQFYAATKRANELMAHSYSHLFGLPTTALRFFTVYGPWGRPDMALFLFTKNILAGQPIEVFHHGQHKRDFTYVDDIVEGITRIMDKIATPDPQWESGQPQPASSCAPFRVYNIGHASPVLLLDYITALEEKIGKKAIKIMKPLQLGDALDTHADTHRLQEAVDYSPQTSIKEGVGAFVDWYLAQYHEKY